MRIRIVFSKTESMRYTSHLDLHRTWERIFRRADLPLAYSEGFHPQPKINLACALPLGITSECEVVDVWMEEWIETNQLSNQIKNVIPPGIRLISLDEVSQSLPSLQTDLVSTIYRVTIPDEIEDLEDRVKNILDADTLVRERRSKKYDLRPLIEELSVLKDEGSHREMIMMRLSARESATGRPDEVLNALSIDSNSADIHRVSIILKNQIISPTSANLQ